MTGYFTLEANKLSVDKNELSRRLCLPKDFDFSAFDEAEKAVKEASSVKCNCIHTPIVQEEDFVVNLGFMKVQSRDLSKNLACCESAFVFCVTLGAAVDRLIEKTAVMSPYKSFIFDGYASSFAESACDEAERIIKENIKCKPRFSPGYGDFALENQKDVLYAVSAEKMLGVALSKSLLMTPKKTITAIMGICP